MPCVPEAFAHFQLHSFFFRTMSHARGVVIGSLDSKAAVYYSSAFTLPWEREGVVASRMEQVCLADDVLAAVRRDASLKYSYGDEIGEGVVSLYEESGDNADEQLKPSDAEHEQEDLLVLWRQLKGTSFAILVPQSTELLIAQSCLSAIIRLLQMVFVVKPLDFEARSLMLRPEVVHTVVSKVLPAGYISPPNLHILKQGVKKAVGMK